MLKTSFLAVVLTTLPATGAAPDDVAEPLADAVENHKRGRINELLERGADVNAAQVEGMTALHWAVWHDDLETARRLVRAKADVHSANRYGVRPLSLACANGNAELVELLLSAGADANTTLPGG